MGIFGFIWRFFNGKKHPVGAYAPHYEDAYVEMQRRLGKFIGKHRVKQIKKSLWGEHHIFRFEVIRNKKVIAVIDYRWGEDPVVVLVSGKFDKLQKFIRNFDNEYNKLVKQYKKKYL